MKKQKIKSSSNLLSQVAKMLGESNHHIIAEARQHVRIAMDRLDKFEKLTTNKEKQSITQSEAWWGNIEAGLSQGFHTQEAWAKSLKAIQSMIDAEKNKLQQLEDQSKKNENDSTNTLLND